MSAVEICFVCDIADCHHMRARRAAKAALPIAIPSAAYVAGLEAALREYADPCDGTEVSCPYQGNMCCKAARAALASRPASPDVRVVTVEQLERWAGSMIDLTDAEIRAIIGGQS